MTAIARQCERRRIRVDRVAIETVPRLGVRQLSLMRRASSMGWAGCSWMQRGVSSSPSTSLVRGDSAVRIWDARTYEQLHILSGHEDIAFRPDGTILALAWRGLSVRLLDTKPLHERRAARLIELLYSGVLGAAPHHASFASRPSHS